MSVLEFLAFKLQPRLDCSHRNVVGSLETCQKVVDIWLPNVVFPIQVPLEQSDILLIFSPSLFTLALMNAQPLLCNIRVHCYL